MKKEDCSLCPQFKEINGKLLIILWITGIGVPSFIGGIAFANLQINDMTQRFTPVLDLPRRVAINEDRVASLQIAVAELQARDRKIVAGMGFK